MFRFENDIPAGKAKRKESGSRWRECMRTAKIGPDLRLHSASAKTLTIWPSYWFMSEKIVGEARRKKQHSDSLT